MGMSSATPARALESDQQQAPTDSRRRWQDLAIILFVGFSPNVIAAIYLLFVPAAMALNLNNLRYFTGIIHQIGILLLFGILLRRQGRRLSDIGFSFESMDLLRGFGLVAVSWIATYLFATFIAFIFYWNGWHLHSRDPAKIFGGTWPLLFVAYTLTSPFYEEILVKGYLITELIGLSRRVWLAALISFLLQSSYHLYYGLFGAMYVSIGFGISAVYFVKTRRLMPVILAHLLWNIGVTYLNLHR